jgi:uncharacterized protein (DUF433 family)
VYDVLSYLAAGMTTDDLLSDFPELTREDILACLSYAADRGRDLPPQSYPRCKCHTPAALS